MKLFSKKFRILPWLIALTSVLIVGCSGSQSPILGIDNPVVPPARPTVTAVAPLNNATGVPINNTIIVAAFSEPMAPITGNASFTLTCALPCASPIGTVALNARGDIATLTLAPGTNLSPNTVYTATVTGATSLATGLALANPFVWQFTTGAAVSTTRPTVVLTVPATTVPGPTPGAPANSAISATFSKAMAPATINAANFTLTCAAPCITPLGTVSYSVGTNTAIFTPAAPLTVGAVYTATISSAATDLQGNALGGNQAPLPAASNYVWTFTTVAAAPPGNVSVKSTNPVANAGNICTNQSINAAFNIPSGLRMDPTTVNSGTFTITGQGAAPVTATSVTLDPATGTIATFMPTALTAGVTYTATIKGGANGVKDLAVPANTMASNFTWNFTAIACTAPTAVPLGTASTFGNFGGAAGMTNQGIQTVINGDIGTTAAATSITGFHDAGPNCTYTETPLNKGLVNGRIYAATSPAGCSTVGAAIAAAARADILTAYNSLVAMPAGSDPSTAGGNLGGLTLAPGVYTSAAGSFRIQGGNLILDAQGNANATWVFQMASTLLVGGPGAAAPQSIILANGAQAKNVFWQVGSAATINAAGGGTMVGTIIAQSGVTISTAGNTTVATLNGRALSLNASVTVVDTVINVPAP